jgi:hypothetical protein
MDVRTACCGYCRLAVATTGSSSTQEVAAATAGRGPPDMGVIAIWKAVLVASRGQGNAPLAGKMERFPCWKSAGCTACRQDRVGGRVAARPMGFDLVHACSSVAPERHTGGFRHGGRLGRARVCGVGSSVMRAVAVPATYLTESGSLRSRDPVI